VFFLLTFLYTLPFSIYFFILLSVACGGFYLLINSFPSSHVGDGLLTSIPDKLSLSGEEIGDENPISPYYGTCFLRFMPVSH
jgi:hypothetical protein